MSRVGRKLITIPNGVKVTVTGNLINVQGPKGKLDYAMDEKFKAEVKDNKFSVSRPGDERKDMARHGLIRALVQNMIVGVTQGYTKELEIRGVGFKAQVQGKKLTLNLGYSHPIVYDIPEGITIQTPKPTQVVVSGIDNTKVGQISAKIRNFYLSEPYKGKGVRYLGEHVRQKAGKKVA